MRNAAILPILFLLLVQPALADWFFNSRNVVADIGIQGSANIVPLSLNGYAESASVNMTFFPKQTDTQELLKFYTSPRAELSGNALKFAWAMPQGRIGFSVNAEVRTTNTIVQVTKKIRFPIESLPDEVAQYTKPSETIDSDDKDIIALANELVRGEDDLYNAVFKIAEWTKGNVNYNLSTLSSEVTQKASWVLQYRQGVCSELTSLFVALSRAVGIPARVVSGMSYTNSPLFPDNWGAHAWAEVYFPGYGWVPFDATYGEFGWVDPTHIKFKDSVDTSEPSTYYQWLGRDVDLKASKLDIQASLTGKTGYSRVPLGIKASPLKKSVSFGSYNLVEADVENFNDFYYATEVYLSKPKEVRIVGENTKGILLLPGETKKVFWVLKVDDGLDSRYAYTFPIVASTMSNITSETSFTASIMESQVSLDDVGQAAKMLEEEKEKKYSGNVALECHASKAEFYEYENASVYCIAKNTGNILLRDIDVCFQNKCQRTSLGISQSASMTFAINTSITGAIEAPVTLNTDIVSKSVGIGFRINDMPKIAIESLNFPENASYKGNFTIAFTLVKKSQSNPKNVEVVFAQNGFSKKWNIDELSEDRKFVLAFEGKRLKYGKNNYRINVDYFDGLRKHYNAEKEFSIELANVTPLQRLYLFFNNLESVRVETLVVMILVGIVAFVGIVMWMFRKR